MPLLPSRSSSRSSRRSRCCGGISVFLVLATLGHMAMFYRLRLCHDCVPSTWLESVQLMELMVTNFSSDVLPWTNEELSPQHDNTKQEIQSEYIQQDIRPESIEHDVQLDDTEQEVRDNAEPEELDEGAEQDSQRDETEQQELQQKAPFEPSKEFKVAMNSSVLNSTHFRWVFRPKSWRPVPATFIKTPFPVFVASLPKSGTTTISNFFMCGGVRSVHTFCPFRVPEGKGQVRIGVLIEENIKKGAPPFEGCGKGFRNIQGPVNVYSDTGYANPGHACYYPSISALEAMYEAYPNMTILLGTRDGKQWFNSVSKWAKGGLLKRWIEYCSAMPDTDDPKEFIEFYEWHNRHIRDFAKRHPSITFVEARIDTPTSGQEFESMTNISSTCWGHFIPTGTRVGANITKGKRLKRAKGRGINQRSKSSQRTRIRRGKQARGTEE